MSLRIFRAGLKHSLVDAKWPAFEEVFAGFDPRRVRAMSDEALESLLGDARLIRHWGKLKAVRDNAAAMLEMAAEHGSFGAWLAGWPGTDIVGLWEALAARFSQMGGNSGPTFLRMVGKDTFILSPSVIAGLKHWAEMPPPKNRQDRAAAQAVFNTWAAETGRPLSQLSLILGPIGRGLAGRAPERDVSSGAACVRRALCRGRDVGRVERDASIIRHRAPASTGEPRFPISWQGVWPRAPAARRVYS